MQNSTEPDLVITGIGVTSAVGQTCADFARALLDGTSAFGVMQRPGRQKGTAFLGAEITSLRLPDAVSPPLLRKMSFSAQAALSTLDQAWHDADLANVDPARIGLVVGGSNVQQRDLMLVQEAYADRTSFLRPTYALSFMDTDLCGFCTEWFGIRGFAYTLGGASASGQLAIIQAAQAVRSGQVVACIAVGALMDLSFWELQALTSLGAMGSERYSDAPELACRPFDRDRDGFIYGESCGAVVIEATTSAARRGAKPYARVSGWGVTMDANRNPDPSLEGETRAIAMALRHARLEPEEIDYVNPHGTGSRIGDATEIEALRASGLSHAFVNATKSITGHGLTAAGNVEVIATLLQMQAGQLHPTRNLDTPIDSSLNWVGRRSVAHRMKHALTLSMGFGGINTALCLSQCS